MMRVLFFFLGVPMMILSFFEAVDVLPYAANYEVYLNGNKVELTVEQEQQVREKVEALFENSRTMPAFAVVTQELYDEQVKDGIFVSIKFDEVLHLNELPFEELVFKVEKDCYGFNLLRGMGGIFQGRCIYIDCVENNMNDLYDFLGNLTSAETKPETEELVQKDEASQDETLGGQDETLGGVEEKISAQDEQGQESEENS